MSILHWTSIKMGKSETLVLMKVMAKLLLSLMRSQFHPKPWLKSIVGWIFKA